MRPFILASRFDELESLGDSGKIGKSPNSDRGEPGGDDDATDDRPPTTEGVQRTRLAGVALAGLSSLSFGKGPRRSSLSAFSLSPGEVYPAPTLDPVLAWPF